MLIPEDHGQDSARKGTNPSLFRGSGLSTAGKYRQIPLVRPEPPRLSQHLKELSEIEASGIYSNYGPVNTRFEEELVNMVFKQGECLTVCNATIGLMLAIREVIGEDRPPQRQYALMPSFTFAATAHAALWCGLTPLLYDIDPETWLPDTDSEESLLREYREQIAVVVPYATFGNNLDLAHYQRLSEIYEVPVVVDAAGSLGSIDENGRAFGSGFPWPVVLSMHATKAFSVGEGGVIYCADHDRIDRLRTAGSFGFGHPRTATSFGLNAKLSEVAALTAHLELQDFSRTVARRELLAEKYAVELEDDFVTQRRRGLRQVPSFQSILLPQYLSDERDRFAHLLRSSGILAGTYFSPHLAEQPYFQTRVVTSDLKVTEDIASRIISLPLLTNMSAEDVEYIVLTLREIAARLQPSAICA